MAETQNTKNESVNAKDSVPPSTAVKDEDKVPSEKVPPTNTPATTTPAGTATPTPPAQTSQAKETPPKEPTKVTSTNEPPKNALKKSAEKKTPIEKTPAAKENPEKKPLAKNSKTPIAKPEPKIPNLVTLDEGFKVGGRWRVVKLLGKGSFGAVYQCEDVTKKFIGVKALKSESTKAKAQSQVLKIEVAVLKAMTGCHHSCRLFAKGRNEEYSFIVMSLLGPSLKDLKDKQPNGKLSLSTASRIVFQCARAVREMHNCDWIHRDVKPANYAMGGTPKTKKVVKIFDFGLSRRYRSNNFKVRPGREEIRFRGTKRYCSISVHHKEEFGRHDDLISLLYMIVEMVKGTLPWHNLGDGNELCKMKLEKGLSIYTGMPKFLSGVHEYLYSLKYDNQPDYSMMEQGLLKLIYDKGFHKQPLDWEKGMPKDQTSATTGNTEGDTAKSEAVKDTKVKDDVHDSYLHESIDIENEQPYPITVPALKT